jgi:DNA-binding NtrC family response regulator
MSTVLVVDDEPLIRWAVRESLEGAGYAVVEAGSASEAMARLPTADLSLMRHVHGEAPACRVIIMTAHGTPELLRDAMTAGAFGTLLKPFDLASVVSMVGAAVQAA